MRQSKWRWVLLIGLYVIVLGGVAFLLPPLFAWSIEHEAMAPIVPVQFPISVDPKNKVIVENAQMNLYFDGPPLSLQAAVGNVSDAFWKIFEWAATAIADAPWYQSLAAVGSNRFVTVTPGMRKEQVANLFAHALNWNSKQKQEFLKGSATSSPLLLEGMFSPGTYSVGIGITPSAAQTLIHDRFYTDVLSHYGTTTAQIIPLNDTLILASLIQRETIGLSDMRLVSGIIWNRLFADMHLQVDATVQYAKANRLATASWWPRVLPADTSIKSPYNTYLHPGLPPTPIANPSVAAILAALNPIHTTCLFYFNDQRGNIHCSDTYAEHVVLLKQYYGRGK